VLPLVVATDEQDESIAVGVAEDPEEEPSGLRRPDHGDLSQVAAQAKLKKPSARLLAKLRCANPDAEPLKDLVHRVAERTPLRRRELLAESAQDRGVAVLVLVELKLVRRHGAGSQHGALSLAVEEQRELPAPRVRRTQMCFSQKVPGVPRVGDTLHHGGPTQTGHRTYRVVRVEWFTGSYAHHAMKHVVIHVEPEPGPAS
jgi:hypothetical protein